MAEAHAMVMKALYVQDETLYSALTNQRNNKIILTPLKEINHDEDLPEDDIVRKIPFFPLQSIPSHILTEAGSERILSLVNRLWTGTDVMAWYFTGEFNNAPSTLVDFRRRENESTDRTTCKFLSFLDVDNLPFALCDLQDEELMGALPED